MEFTQVQTKYSCSLYQGDILYEFMAYMTSNTLIMEGFCIDNTTFIKVIFDTPQNDIDISKIINLVEPYIFELNKNYELDISLKKLNEKVRWEEYFLEEYEIKEYFQNKHKNKMIHLVEISNGTIELIKIHNQANKFLDYDISILLYYKCIEYVQTTVLKETLINDGINKLNQYNFSDISARMIIELEEFFDNNRSNNERFKIFPLILEKCCDFNTIIRKNEQNFLQLRISVEDKKRAIQNLCKKIIDTRDEIAHGKTNYRKKGGEVPEDKREFLVILMQQISQYLIFWFNRKNDQEKIF